MKILPAYDLLSVGGIVSGIVGTKRKGTHYVRRRYTEEHQSPLQIQWRSAFATSDLAWQGLELSLKQAWRNYQSWRQNWGYNRFMSVNIPRSFQGLPLILDPANIP